MRARDDLSVGNGNRLHLQNASMQFSDPGKQINADLDVILQRNAHIVHLTETAHMHGTVHAACAGNGYKFWAPDRGDSSFAVRDDLELVDTGFEFVVPANRVPAAKGGYTAKGIAWVKVKHHGETIFMHGTHWLTGFRKGGKRRLLHIEQTEALVRNVEKHGSGSRLAFWAGDTNLHDGRDWAGYDNLLDDARLTSIWDEVGKYPSTHGGPRGGTIDLIGTYDPDGRVILDRTKVWGSGNSDHYQVSAWFHITPQRAPSGRMRS